MPQLQLQLHYVHYTTTTTPLHYITTTTTTALHRTTSISCGWGIYASQQLTSPIVSCPWNFRHRLVRYYWYVMCIVYIYVCISQWFGITNKWSFFHISTSPDLRMPRWDWSGRSGRVSPRCPEFLLGIWWLGVQMARWVEFTIVSYITTYLYMLFVYNLFII